MPVAELPGVEQHFAAARVLQKEGRLAEAAQQWVAGLQIDPRHEAAYLSLADALLELKLFQPAAIACQQALLAFPLSAGAHDRLGLVFDALGNRAQAVANYSQSLKLRPGDQAVSHRLAAALRAAGCLDQARAVLEGVCNANSQDAGSRFLLAGILADLAQPEEAIRLLRKAIALQPQFPEAHNNLALLLRNDGQTETAAAHLRKALAIRPQYAAAWNNLGNTCVELSQIDEAIGCYTKALTLDPNYAEAHTNRALALLLQGNFEAGWTEYEWRWKQPGMSTQAYAKSEWDGLPLDGKSILLRTEQGAGDTIQFLRYARMLHCQGVEVLLHCQESLRTLLQAMPELSGVYCGAELPDFDVHAPLMSLPRLFGTSLETIPTGVPYLRALPDMPVLEVLESCRQFRVGLVWSGNPNHRNDRNRSIPLRQLSGLSVEGAQLFSLQLGRSQAEADCLQTRGIVDLSEHLSDYAATAKCLENIDLLITVDTSIAHLAGALGRPVWVLLPSCSDWRWLEKRQDSPWYPSMRLYRQAKLREWRPAIARVAADLQLQIDAHKTDPRKT